MTNSVLTFLKEGTDEDIARAKQLAERLVVRTVEFEEEYVLPLVAFEMTKLLVTEHAGTVEEVHTSVDLVASELKNRAEQLLEENLLPEPDSRFNYDENERTRELLTEFMTALDSTSNPNVSIKVASLLLSMAVFRFAETPQHAVEYYRGLLKEAENDMNELWDDAHEDDEIFDGDNRVSQ